MAIAKVDIKGFENKPSVIGQYRRVTTDILIAAYSAGGGEAITPELFGLKKILYVDAMGALDGTRVVADLTTGANKIKALDAAGAERAGASNPGLYRIQVTGI